MLLKIIIAVAVLLVVLCIVIATRPASFRYSRSRTIAAPPAALFEQVNDVQKFQAWNPFAKMDPTATNTYSGPPAGVGSACTWSGNNKVGEGTMTNVESRPNELVRFKLDFRKPMAATNIGEFTFVPEGDKTVVTWSMSGENGFMAKAFGLFVNCDKMVGGEFEKGLADLDATVHANAKP